MGSYAIPDGKGIINGSKFCKFLSHFTNVELLDDADGMLISEDWDDQDLPKLQQLKAIYWDPDNIIDKKNSLWNKILQKHAQQIEYINHAAKEKLSNLRQLRIHPTDIDIAKSYTYRNLEVITLMHLRTLDDKLMFTLLQKQPNLTKIEIVYPKCTWNKLLISINEGIKSYNKKKLHFRICFETKYVLRHSIKNFMQTVKDFVATLAASVDDFKIHFEWEKKNIFAKEYYCGEPWITKMMKVWKINQNIVVDELITDNLNIVVMNKQYVNDRIFEPSITLWKDSIGPAR